MQFRPHSVVSQLHTHIHIYTHTHGTIRSRFLRLKQIMGECRLYLRFLSRATKNFPGDFLSFSFSPLSSSKGTQREDSAAIRIIIINWKWFYSLKSLSFSFSLSALRLFSRSSADIIDISLFVGTSYLCSNSLFLFFLKVRYCAFFRPQLHSAPPPLPLYGSSFPFCFKLFQV